MSKFIQCFKCGGTQGTLVKVGDKYGHIREKDCERHRTIAKAKIRREEVLKQARRDKNGS